MYIFNPFLSDPHMSQRKLPSPQWHGRDLSETADMYGMLEVVPVEISGQITRAKVKGPK